MSASIDEVTIYNNRSLNIVTYGHRISYINSIEIMSEGDKTIIIIDKPGNVIVKDKNGNILRRGIFYMLAQKLKRKGENRCQ